MISAGSNLKIPKACCDTTAEYSHDLTSCPVELSHVLQQKHITLLALVASCWALCRAALVLNIQNSPSMTDAGL